MHRRQDNRPAPHLGIQRFPHAASARLACAGAGFHRYSPGGIGHFDSDTSALITRAALNASRTEHDLEAWIFGQVPLREAGRIADLGCGTGKQLFALAARLSADTEIIGVDISAQAVAEVSARAEREGRPNVRALRASLDDCPEALPRGRFDLILSSYAIYYARDVGALLERISGVLNPGGQIFVCGPAAGTNHEMIMLVNELLDEDDGPLPEVDDFLDPTQIDALRAHYSSVATPRMQNTVTFTSVDETMSWLRNHNMYRSEVDRGVLQELERHFATQPEFRLIKNVLAVHGRV